MLVSGLVFLILSTSTIFYFTIQSIETRFNHLVEVEEPAEMALYESETSLEGGYNHVLDYNRNRNSETLDMWVQSSTAFENQLRRVESKVSGEQFSEIFEKVIKQYGVYKLAAEEVIELADKQSSDLEDLRIKTRQIERLVGQEIASAESGGILAKAGKLDLLIKMKSSIEKTFSAIDAYLAFQEPRLRKEASEALMEFTKSLKELEKPSFLWGKADFNSKIGAIYAESALLAAEIIDREDEKQRQLDVLKDLRIGLKSLLTGQLATVIREQMRLSMEETNSKSSRAKLLLYITATVSVLLALIAFGMLRKVMQSLRIIANGVEKLGHGGFDHQLELVADDELGDLASVFNAMITKRKSAEAALSISMEKYRNLFEHANDGIIIFDPETREILETNEILAYRLGYDKQEMLSLKIDDIIMEGFDPEVDAPYLAMREGKSLIFERTHRKKDGSPTPVEISAKQFSYGGRQVVQALVRDISKRKETERELKLASYVFETAMEGVIVTGADATIQFVNPAFTRITGYTAEEALGKKPNILRSPVNDKEFYEKMWEALLMGGQWRGEIWNRHKSGRIYPEWLTITAIKDSAGRIIQYAAVFHDITDLKRNEEEIKFQAFHDPLTGLPNRLLFRDRLKHAIDKAQREASMVGVLFLDLDDFKNINDSMGHDVGDLLLKGMSVRLIGCLREVDTVARIGGDEFIIILEGVRREDEAIHAAGRIIKSLSEPYVFKGENLYCTTSVGITMYPSDGSGADELIKNADLAMYHAKGLGKNNYQFFDRTMNDKMIRRVEMEKGLRKALEKDQFTCVYQPKFELTTMKVVGVEALARWVSEGEYITAAEFISVAEESNLIMQISEVIFLKACLAARRLHAAGFERLRMAVNVSAKQLERQKLVAHVSQALEKSGLEGEYLELEMKEAAVLKDPELAMKTMQELKQMGVCMSIDDFGTGYSSLFHLKKFPLTCLKIDRMFVREILDNNDDSAIAKATISIGHNMGLKVIAEGVESSDQMEYLKSLGCDEVQGFLLSTPLPEERLIEFLTDRAMDAGKLDSIKITLP